MTALATRLLTVTTSEAHLKIVAQHYALDVRMDFEGDKAYLVTKREVPKLGTLEYRAPYRLELTA